MPLFEVAILRKPTKKEAEEEGKTEELIFGPKAVVARDVQGAGIAAARSGEIPADLDINKCEVLVRPFA